jgi:membrane protein YqaA with SNARE-associated domain
MDEEKVKKKKKKKGIKQLHQYYSYTGFYKFVREQLQKYIWPLLFIIVSLVVLNRFVFDVKAYFSFITQDYAAEGILLIFFISEATLGIIPPDIFIGWAEFQDQPYLILTFLGILSYLGGLVAYSIGFWIYKIPKVKTMLEERYPVPLRNARRWGGLLIIAAALLPLPFSPICILIGAIGYRFRDFALLTLFRFLRFALYGVAIFSIF